jgi:hypothetical protein
VRQNILEFVKIAGKLLKESKADRSNCRGLASVKGLCALARGLVLILPAQ